MIAFNLKSAIKLRLNIRCHLLIAVFLSLSSISIAQANTNSRVDKVEGFVKSFYQNIEFPSRHNPITTDVIQLTNAEGNADLGCQFISILSRHTFDKSYKGPVTIYNVSNNDVDGFCSAERAEKSTRKFSLEGNLYRRDTKQYKVNHPDGGSQFVKFERLYIRADYDENASICPIVFVRHPLVQLPKNISRDAFDARPPFSVDSTFDENALPAPKGYRSRILIENVQLLYKAPLGLVAGCYATKITFIERTKQEH